MTPIAPGATLGVLGGGQLGRMFVHAAQRLGYATAVLESDGASPAGLVSQHHIRAGYSDAAGLAELARIAAAITTEFENVPAASLASLARSRPVAPGAAAVAVTQDRAREKAHFVACGVRCAAHALLETPAQLAALSDDLLPGILKTARLGYDGKGQVRVRDRAELGAAWQQLGRAPCVLEKMLPLAAECSVIVARGADGALIHFPPQRNLHRDGILAVTEVFDGNLPAPLAAQAVDAARRIAQTLDYVGVLCVEFFVLTDGTLVANEMAPRPHNSGHYSIDACDLSQFDAQVRALAGLPLVMPRLHSSAVMLNLLGDLWFRADASTGAAADGAAKPDAQATAIATTTTAVEPPWAAVLALPGAHLHLYGKAEARAGRKMGHLTFTAQDIGSARASALQACALLGLPGLA